MSFTPSQSFELKCYLSKCGKHGYFTFRLIIPVSEMATECYPGTFIHSWIDMYSSANALSAIYLLPSLMLRRRQVTKIDVILAIITYLSLRA